MIAFVIVVVFYCAAIVAVLVWLHNEVKHFWRDLKEGGKEILQNFALGRIYFGLTDSRLSEMRRHETAREMFQSFLNGNTDRDGR